MNGKPGARVESLRRGVRAAMRLPRTRREAVRLVVVGACLPSLSLGAAFLIGDFRWAPGPLFADAVIGALVLAGGLAGLLAIGLSVVYGLTVYPWPPGYELPIAAYRGWAFGIALAVAWIGLQLWRVERSRRLAGLSERRYRQLADDLPGIVWEVSAETGEALFVSQSAREILGLDPADVLAPGSPARAGHPDDQATFAELIDQTVRKGRNVGELRVRHADGRWVWLRVQSHLVLDAGGKPVAIRGVSLDISDERAAREVARAEEDRYRRLFEAGQFGAIVVDSRDRLIGSINPTLAHLLGYEPEELVGQPAPLISPDDSPAFGDPRMPLLLSGAIPSFRKDVVMRHRDGSSRHLDLVVIRDKPAEDGVIRAIGLLHDRTAAIAAERELAESETRYRTLFDVAFGGLCISADGVMLDVNAGLAEIFGRPAAELIGRTPLDFFGSETDERVREAIRQNTLGRVTATILRPDGEHVQVEGVAVPIVYQGRPARLTAVRDVTAEQRLAEQARQSQKLEAIGRLAGGVAHDFNNLLQVVSGSTALALAALEDQAVLRTELAEVAHAADRASELTRQLLAFALNEPARAQLIDVNGVVRDVRRLLERVIGREIELTVQLDERPSSCVFDRTNLEQVLVNLATNARDAMPGGGRLGIATTITEGGGGDGNGDGGDGGEGPRLLLRVSDSGVGMDEQTASRVFEPFFTTKPAGQGTGLGLATVYGIVTGAGGTVTLDTHPGVGTDFTISLPCVLAAAPVAGTDGRRPELVKGSGRVLVVDDDASVLRLLRQMLEAAGYEVTSAASGDEALALAASARFDLLVTDLSMPMMTGLDLAAAVRELFPEIPVLFVSGNPHRYDAHGGLAIGNSAVVTKPFDVAVLAEQAFRLIVGAAV